MRRCVKEGKILSPWHWIRNYPKTVVETKANVLETIIKKKDFVGYKFRQGLAAFLSHGISPEVAIRYWQGLQLSEGSAGLLSKVACLHGQRQKHSKAVTRKPFQQDFLRGGRFLTLASCRVTTAREKSSMAFANLASEVTWQCCYHTLLVKAVASPSWFKSRDGDWSWGADVTECWGQV